MYKIGKIFSFSVMVCYVSFLILFATSVGLSEDTPIDSTQNTLINYVMLAAVIIPMVALTKRNELYGQNGKGAAVANSLLWTLIITSVCSFYLSISNDIFKMILFVVLFLYFYKIKSNTKFVKAYFIMFQSLLIYKVITWNMSIDEKLNKIVNLDELVYLTATWGILITIVSFFLLQFAFKKSDNYSYNKDIVEEIEKETKPKKEVKKKTTPLFSKQSSILRKAVNKR